MPEQKEYTNLELVSRVDTWPYLQANPEAYHQHMKSYYYLLIANHPKPVGYVHSATIASVNWPPFWTLDHTSRTLIFNGGDDFETRTQRMAQTLLANPKTNESSPFSRWSDELFPIYSSEGEHILDLDGAGVDAFGIVNYSCHMIAYVDTVGGRKYWVPRRGARMSFAGMLDNTVGGSLRSGEKPLDCIVREAGEEAGLSEEVIRKGVKACGTLSYTMTRTDDGKVGCQHQVQYVYELELPEDVKLAPVDSEAESFSLMTLDEVVAALRKGEFKLNCAMTWMAFLIRHGHVNAENEPSLVEICARLHRKHDLFVL